MRTPVRSFLLILGLLIAAIGFPQPNYATHWTRTYGTTDDEANAMIGGGSDPLLVFERIYSSNSSSAILIAYDQDGVVKWGTNINGVRANDRHTPVAISTGTSQVFVLVLKGQSPLVQQGIVYCFRYSDGQKLWSYSLPTTRTPQAMISSGSSVIVATRSIYGEVKATRLNANTGAVVRDDVIANSGSVNGGETGYATPHFFFYGSSGNQAAFWHATTAGFSIYFSPVGSERASWTTVSRDGLHIFGQTDNLSGSYRALYGYRSTDSGAFTVVPLPVPISAGGGLHTYEFRPVDYFENTRNRIGYRQVAGNTDIIRRLEADREGFITSLAPVALPTSAANAQSFTVYNDFHYLANYAVGASKIYGAHQTLPNYTFTKTKEQITDGANGFVASTFEKAQGDRDIALRKLRLPRIPNPMTEHHLGANTQSEYSSFGYQQSLIQGFGFTDGITTIPFSHGITGFSTVSYYQPDLNFTGSDTATFSVGNPAATAQVRMNVGMPHEVESIAFRNLGEVIGGRTMEARLTLTRRAPGGGLLVPMSTNSTLMSVPAQVYVEGGAKTAKFLVSTQKVFASTSRKIVFGPGPSDFANVILIPGGLNTFNIGPSSVKGGNSATGSISLTGTLPTYLPGATISITANGGSVAFPSSVTIGPGNINKTFTINTSTVASNVVRTFTVTQGVTQLTKTLTITP